MPWNLNFYLQCGHREFRMRPGRDPQPEVRVGGLHPKVVHQILELVHPLRGHVAVQEDNPGAGLVAFLSNEEQSLGGEI